MKMKAMKKTALALAAGAVVLVAAGCAEHAPAFVCGKPVDYKSMASCKGKAKK